MLTGLLAEPAREHELVRTQKPVLRITLQDEGRYVDLGVLQNYPAAEVRWQIDQMSYFGPTCRLS